MPRTGIAGSHGSSVCRFLRDLHTSCICLHSHHQYRGLPLFAHPLAFMFIEFLMMVVLTCVMWYLTVVLICIFLIISDTEHLFMCLRVSSLQKCLLRSFAHFLIGLFVVVELYELFEYFGDYAKGLLFLMCYYCKQSSAFLF